MVRKSIIIRSNTSAVLLGVLLGPAMGVPNPAAFSTCAVGFSAVLFARLKVVLNDGSPTHTYVFGMAAPTKSLPGPSSSSPPSSRQREIHHIIIISGFVMRDSAHALRLVFCKNPLAFFL